MNLIALASLATIALAGVVPVQTQVLTPTQAQPLTPTQTAIAFYEALREKKYVEGFRLSVYRDAVEGLTAAQLEDLGPDFAQTFSEIPEKIDAHGEQITGDIAIVLLKFDGIDLVQHIALIKVGAEWLVGDKEALEMVKVQGRSFFFNARMAVNESEAAETLSRIVDAEDLYSRRFDGKCATLEELVKLGALPQDLNDGEVSGYRFAMTVAADQKSYSISAVPVRYGGTGKLSFYADAKGIHAQDLKGKPASAKSPAYEPK